MNCKPTMQFIALSVALGALSQEDASATDFWAKTVPPGSNTHSNTITDESNCVMIANAYYTVAPQLEFDVDFREFDGTSWSSPVTVTTLTPVLESGFDEAQFRPISPCWLRLALNASGYPMIAFIYPTLSVDYPVNDHEITRTVFRIGFWEWNGSAWVGDDDLSELSIPVPDDVENVNFEPNGTEFGISLGLTGQGEPAIVYFINFERDHGESGLIEYDDDPPNPNPNIDDHGFLNFAVRENGTWTDFDEPIDELLGGDTLDVNVSHVDFGGPCLSEPICFGYLMNADLHFAVASDASNLASQEIILAADDPITRFDIAVDNSDVPIVAYNGWRVNGSLRPLTAVVRSDPVDVDFDTGDAQVINNTDNHLHVYEVVVDPSLDRWRLLATEPSGGDSWVISETGLTTWTESEICDSCYNGESGSLALEPTTGAAIAYVHASGIYSPSATTLGGACGIGGVQWIRVQDITGQDLVLFSDLGDVVLRRGTLTASGTPTLAAGSQFVIRTPTTIVATVDDEGDFVVKGTASTGTVASPGGVAYEVRNESGVLQSYVDASGNLRAKEIIEHGVKR